MCLKDFGVFQRVEFRLRVVEIEVHEFSVLDEELFGVVDGDFVQRARGERGVEKYGDKQYTKTVGKEGP